MAAPAEPAPRTPSEAHARPAADICAGLSEEEAAKRLADVGPNQLRAEPAPSRLVLVARQFGNSMVLLLVGAAAISLSIGELLDAGVILAIVVATRSSARSRRDGPTRRPRRSARCSRRPPTSSATAV